MLPSSSARTLALGADIVLYDRASEDRTEIANTIAQERGAAFIHPFDNPHIIAGQGTAGLELMQQAAEIAAMPDTIMVCCAGGGLLAGVALAVKHAAPSAEVHPVEPAGFDDFDRSLRTGTHQTTPLKSGSICDALLVDQPGKITFALAREMCSPGFVVTDDEVRTAMRFAFYELKLVIEPGGAAALAAIFAQKCDTHGRIVACTISGGNVDPQQFAQIIA